MTQPYEVIAAPFTVWAAPVGEAFPDIDADPAGNWAKVGTSGDRSITEDGVTVNHAQSVEYFRALGSVGPIKAFRTAEDLMVSFAIADLSLEQYAHALNQNSVTETANERKIGLSRGLTVNQIALLIRGPSPYDDSLALQYEVPIAVQSGEPEVVSQKGEAAALALQFTALEDPNAASEDERFGRIVADDGET